MFRLIVLLDLKKAFNAEHSILSSKLELYAITVNDKRVAFGQQTVSLNVAKNIYAYWFSTKMNAFE